MELPRIASQSSICPQAIPPGIRLLTQPCGRPKTPISKRKLLSSSIQQQQQQQQEPQIPTLPCAPQYRPSRRREEAQVLQNLRRKFNAAKVLQANRPEPVEASASTANNNVSPDDVDDRPNLFQKILLNRPVSMILDLSEIRTAWQDSDFITDCLCWHNVYRQRHNSPPLNMSPELCHLAQTWANHLAHTNKFYYRNDRDIGQNLFCRATNVIVTDVSGQEVTTYWYAAVKQYDFGNEPDRLRANVNAGHFTQLVWRRSSYLGIGKARSRSGKIVVVAHYAPAGNVPGAYLQNVFPPCEELPRVPAPRRYVASVGSTTSESSGSTTAST